ncbi:MAG: hypothetical protein AB7G17_03790 [Phycisphaerales bacterium]
MKRSRFATLAAALTTGALAMLSANAYAGGKTCIITGEPVEAGSPTAEFNGKTVDFCCKRCLRKWDAMSDSEKTATLAKFTPPAEDHDEGDDHHAHDDANPVPAGNAACPGCDEVMSGPPAHTVVFKGVAIGLCCAGCEAKWTKMDEDARFDFLLAHADMGPVNDTCPIGNEPIDLATPTTRVMGKTIGYCCAGCEKHFAAKPADEQKAFLAKYADLPVANTWCPVGKHEVNANGGQFVFNGKKIQLCCPDCIPGWIKMSNTERQAALVEALEAGKSNAAH